MCNLKMNAPISQQLAGGVLWAALGTYIPRLLSVAKVIVLARLLDPEAFGVLAVALTVLAGFNLFSNLGLKPTLVQYRKKIEPAATTAFWLIVLISLALSGLCTVFAEPLSQLMKSPQAVGPLRVIAWTMTIDGLGLVPAALLERRLAFKARAICDCSTALIVLVVALVLALAGMKVWSLVWSQVASSGTFTMTLFFAAKWLPKGYPDKTVALELVRYGRYIMGSSLFSFVNQNIDNVCLSRLRSESELGIYSLAYRFSELPVELLSVINRVVFPAYAGMQSQPKKVNNLLLRTSRYTTMMAAPIAVYSVLFAPFLVPAVLGSQWKEAITPLRFLGLLSLFRSINRNLGDLLKATGFASLAMLITFQGTLILVIGMPIGVSRWGASGAALVLSLNSVIAFVRVLWYVQRSVKMSIGEILLKAILVPILIAVIGGAVAVIVFLFEIPNLLKLGFGTMIYAVILLFLWFMFLKGDLKFAWEVYKPLMYRLFARERCSDSFLEGALACEKSNSFRNDPKG